jgi:hypothetical protein
LVELLRHDNGLVFGSRQYRAVVNDYQLKLTSLVAIVFGAPFS